MNAGVNRRLNRQIIGLLLRRTLRAFGREHLNDLMCLTGDRGAGSWLRARQNEVTRVPIHSAAVDIDTPSDAARLTYEATIWIRFGR
jgi:hypothetical protein